MSSICPFFTAYEITYTKQKMFLLNQKSSQCDDNSNSPAIKYAHCKTHGNCWDLSEPYFLLKSLLLPFFNLTHLCSATQPSRHLTPCEVTSLWPHILSCLLVGVSVMLLQPQQGRSQNTGPLCMKRIKKQSSPALLILDKADCMSPQGRYHLILSPQYTNRCPSGLFNIRCFQW